MTDVDGDEWGSPDYPTLAGPDDPIERVEGYTTNEGVVLYDAQNPLAWIKSTTAASIEDAR